MDYNFHTHTYRCKHATGTEREYIENAIAAGIKRFGFSDHIPAIFPRRGESDYRVPKELESEYVNTIRTLKEEYKNRIEIHIGYETECYPQYFDAMVADAKKAGIEYLILGQHFVDCGEPDLHWVRRATEDEEKLKIYVDCIIAAIKSGVITYVAHPDMFVFTGSDEIYKKEMTRLCICAKEHSMPLEINFLGIRHNRDYPNEKFWEIAGKIGVSVLFGFDAHDVCGAADTASLPTAKKIVKKYNLNLITNPKLTIL